MGTSNSNCRSVGIVVWEVGGSIFFLFGQVLGTICLKLLQGRPSWPRSPPLSTSYSTVKVFVEPADIMILSAAGLARRASDPLVECIAVGMVFALVGLKSPGRSGVVAAVIANKPP